MKYRITTERADLFDVNMMIGMEISVGGTASEESIHAAFENAVSRHEILTSKVLLEADGGAYYIDNDEKNNSMTFAEYELESTFQEQEKIRFRVESGEYLRVFVRMSEKGFSALFLMHHLAGDGKSLLYFIETFMRALNGEGGDIIPIRLLTPTELSENSRLPWAAKLLTAHYNRLWKKEKQVFSFEDKKNSHERFWAKHQTEVKIQTCDAEQVEQIKQEAKQSGCRMTAYITTKYLEGKQGKRDIGYAVDGRIDGNRSMGNQAAGISVNTEYDRRKTFAQNALRIQKLIDKKLSSPMYKYFILHFMAEFDPTLVDAVNLQFADSFDSKTSRKLAELLGYGEKTKDLSLTNLTVPDIPDKYGDFEIEDIIFVPPVVSYGKNIVGIVTHHGRMNIAIHKYTERRAQNGDIG